MLHVVTLITCIYTNVLHVVIRGKVLCVIRLGNNRGAISVKLITYSHACP